ncbi:hypothetical protein RvY_02022 [Ramazzottius varieornatus]|uniref:Secreted protein n=1 Tax=Ramazzottius varieornatus TaxID=947166 RepID=A0A1D1UIB6_RAMVA|nr:hypothetical protein RvY_02022 [Ramazzottius varieornatus]
MFANDFTMFLCVSNCATALQLAISIIITSRCSWCRDGISHKCECVICRNLPKLNRTFRFGVRRYRN